jgi:RimJ/RimL family protein N-acetyltransferase
MKSKLTIEKDIFNSKIFKEEFGNVTDYFKDISEIEIKAEVKNAHFSLFGIKVDSKDLAAMHSFQKAGFYVVDCLVTYEFDKEKCILPDLIPTLDFKNNLDSGEIEILAQVAHSVFKFDRFHSDPNIKAEYADNYYYQWLKNSFAGFSDGAFVPLMDGEVAGFATYKINNVDSYTSTIVLNAVATKFMGKGVYQNIILKATKELLKKSSRIRIGTQAGNIPVQRTLQKLGYKLIDVKYVLHFYKQKDN